MLGWLSKVRGLFDAGKPIVQERRDVIRLGCRVMLEIGESKTKVMASDISPKGLRLESREALKKGEMINVLLPGSARQHVRCRVIWCRKIARSENYSAGIVYDDTKEALAASWARDVLRQAGFGDGRIKERRAHVRVPSLLRATLASRAGELLTDGEMLNIGVGGALVAVGITVDLGTQVRLQVDPIAGFTALDILSTVRSSRKDVKRNRYLHGLRFERQDDPLVVRYLGVLIKQPPN